MFEIDSLNLFIVLNVRKAAYSIELSLIYLI